MLYFEKIQNVLKIPNIRLSFSLSAFYVLLTENISIRALGSGTTMVVCSSFTVPCIVPYTPRFSYLLPY